MKPQKIYVRDLPAERLEPPKETPFLPLLPQVLHLECIYGAHKGDVMHRGTIYCRECYDKRNPYGTLIN